MLTKKVKLWNGRVGDAVIVPRSDWQMQQRKPTFNCECGAPLLGDAAHQGIYSDGLIFCQVYCKSCKKQEIYFLEGWEGGSIGHDRI